MGHFVRAFVVQASGVAELCERVRAARAFALPQNFAIIPLVEAFDEEIEAPSEALDVSDVALVYYQPLPLITAPLVRLALACSAATDVAYIETEYFGGVGSQGAVLWRKGHAIVGPHRATHGPINEVFRALGVAKGKHHDEFDALGLGRVRDTEDWIERGTPFDPRE